MFPVPVTGRLYRGFKQSRPSNKNMKEAFLRNGYMENKSFSSFSRNREVAAGKFAIMHLPSYKGFVIVINKAGVYPGINSAKIFRNGIRGHNPHEQEVTLAPGWFVANRNLNGKLKMTSNGDYVVTYIPSRNNKMKRNVPINNAAKSALRGMLVPRRRAI